MNKQEANRAILERGLAEGEHVVLRPVRQQDLHDLARLLAECPYAGEPIPWTHQRLKQKFEDKDKPGLWDDKHKTYVAVRRQGGVVGFIREGTERDGKYWCELHVADKLPDRDALGSDVAATYLAYKQKWHRPRRISFALLLLESDKALWLEAAGFEQELVFDQAVLHRGRPTALAYFTWVAEWALAARAERHPVPGEDRPRREL